MVIQGQPGSYFYSNLMSDINVLVLLN